MMPLPHETALGYIAPLPACPTGALPRTNDKIEVMTHRRTLGKSLSHPEDRTDGEPDYRPLWDKILEAVAGIFYSENCYRAAPRLPGKGRRGGRKVNLGRFRTRAEAAEEVLRWNAAGCPPTWTPRRPAPLFG